MEKTRLLCPCGHAVCWGLLHGKVHLPSESGPFWFPCCSQGLSLSEEGLWSSALFDELLGFPFPPLCIFLGSIPWPHPPGHPLPKPLAHEGIYGIYSWGIFLSFYWSVTYIYPCSFHKLDEFSHSEATCDQCPRGPTHTFLSPTPNRNHDLHLQYSRLDSECSINRIYFLLSVFLVLTWYLWDSSTVLPVVAVCSRSLLYRTLLSALNSMISYTLNGYFSTPSFSFPFTSKCFIFYFTESLQSHCWRKRYACIQLWQILPNVSKVVHHFHSFEQWMRVYNLTNT